MMLIEGELRKKVKDLEKELQIVKEREKWKTEELARKEGELQVLKEREKWKTEKLARKEKELEDVKGQMEESRKIAGELMKIRKLIEKRESADSTEVQLRHLKEEEIEKGQLIGRGAFGAVYSCVIGDARYAVKVLYLVQDQSQQRKITELFKQEVEVLSQLQHSQLTKLIGVCETKEELMIVMKLFDSSMERVIATRKAEVDADSNGRFSPQEITGWCIQILKGLAYLHSKNIAHRDLKVLSASFEN